MASEPIILDGGNITLYCGDCLKILPTLEPGSADCVIADPPYGIGYSTGGGGGGFKNKDKGRYPKTFTGDDLVIGDDKPFDPAPILALNLPSILWGGNHYASRLPDSAAWLIWYKRFSPTDFADCEIAWTNLGGVARVFRHLWNGGIRASEHGTPRLHPTQKPVALMEWCLSFLPDATTILDPYMGSGTTGVACIRTGRKFIGIEKHPPYFAIAVKRIQTEIDARDGQGPMMKAQEKLC
jgi:site-specific DNA-methyltransferase (adenine-specific)/modification methylase